MKYKYDNEEFDVRILDDGTLDTVISVNGEAMRYDSESMRNDDGSIPESSITTAIEDYLDCRSCDAILSKDISGGN